MGMVVDAAQPLRVDVAVHLRRGERRVAEQLLDRRAGRRRPRAGASRTRGAGGAGWGTSRRSVEVSRRRPRAERNERVLGAAGELRARVAQVARDERGRLLAERDDAVLRALAVADVDELLLEVDVAEVEPDRLRAAQPGRVDELDQRAVAESRAAPSLGEPGDDRVDLARLRRVGKPARPPRARAGRRATRSAPSEKRRSARTAASLRAIVAGASLPPGRGPAELGRPSRRARARRRPRAANRGPNHAANSRRSDA